MDMIKKLNFLLALLATLGFVLGQDRAKRSSFETQNIHKTWNASRIPYTIYPGTPTHAVREIQNSFRLLMKKTCLVFKKRVYEKHFMGFDYQQKRGACFVSRIGVDPDGATNISLSSRCLQVHSILHYVFHALGFHHQQNRHDAGKYLTVNMASVTKITWQGMVLRLLPYGGVSDERSRDLAGPFDYQSIMLYDDLARARTNAKGPVLVNIQNPDMRVGGLHGPTDMDYLKIGVRFNCADVKVRRGKKLGEWGPWGEWTPKDCPVRCGIGFQQRFRWCNGSNVVHCSGISTETRQCDSCAGAKCRNLGGDRFCSAFANCNREYHVMYCRKFCKYCGSRITNAKSDYFCMKFARPHCKEAWAKTDCPVTCSRLKQKR